MVTAAASVYPSWAMPFTPAHVAAVLPLRGRVHLPFAALAAGAMSPDLPYFLTGGGSIPRFVTHGAWSIVTWDLVLGLAMWAAWRGIAPALHDLAPTPVRRRWQPPQGPHPAWWAVALAIIVGSATHVLWDALTHPGAVSGSIGALTATYPSPRGPMAGYRYLQYISGVAGLAVVLWAGFRLPTSPPGPRTHPGLAALAPAVLFGGALLAVGLRVATMHDPTDRRALVFAAVTASISGAGLALILLCALHGATGQDRRRTIT